MTVPTTTNTAIGTGNGVATVFPFTFGTLPAGNLVVTLFDLDGNEIPQTIVTDYTVLGAGAEDGGSVVFVVPPPADYTVLIQRIIPETQPDDLKNQGSYYPRTVERMFDRVTMLIQQLSESIARTLRLPPHIQGVSTELPAPEPLNLIGWDATNAALRNFTVGDIGTTLAFSNFIADPFTASAGQVNFTLTADPGAIGNLDVSIDGVTQIPFADYTYAGNTLTFVTPMVGGEKVLARYGTALPTGITATDSILYTPPSTGVLGTLRAFLDSLWSTGTSAGAALIRYIRTGTGAVDRTIQDKLRLIEVDLFEFGYTTGMPDATLPIQRAIDSLPARGGRVRLPPDTISVAGTINIGNGDGGLNPSTTHGVKLVGTGSGLIAGAVNPTLINYTGPLRTSALITVNGRIGDCTIEDILIGLNGNSGGIEMKAFGGCRVRNVKILNPSTGSNGLAIIGGEAPTGNYNIFNEFDNVQVALLQPNCHGLYMDGVYGVGAMNDTWISTFTRLRIEVIPGATNAVCARFRFVDSISFYRCHFDSAPEPSARGCVFDATGSDLYPGGLAFYDCSIKDTLVLEDGSHHIGTQYFYGFGTADLEPLPVHPNLRGITDDGRIFGDFLYNQEWTAYAPTVTLVGGAGNTVPVYTTNQGRYKKIGKTVHFAFMVDGDGGTDGAGTGVINIALPVQVRNIASYYAEIHGRVVLPGASYVGIGRIIAGGTTMPIRYLNGTILSDLTGADQAGQRTIVITGTYECE